MLSGDPSRKAVIAGKHGPSLLSTLGVIDGAGWKETDIMLAGTHIHVGMIEPVALRQLLQ